MEKVRAKECPPPKKPKKKKKRKRESPDCNDNIISSAFT